MIWILAWFLAAALIAPVLGKLLNRAGTIAEVHDGISQIEQYLERV